jgi:drug/metabolite transporter (DMT)-like permease
MLAGLAASGGQFAITAAYSNAPAKEISVFDYSQIIFAALLGFVLFGQVPDIYSIIGYVTICGASVAMFLYNKE